jgi:hypothetical protein
VPDASSFSSDYVAARARFRAAALAAGWDTLAVPIPAVGPNGEQLTVDVARLGPERAERLVVVSSGLHGVEGFFGSAVQAALLEERLPGWAPPPGLAVVLIHALNPYGFAAVRRVNENNVDLNRNFLLDGERYDGAPPGYGGLDPLLNPKTPPGGFEAFLLRASFNIARHGLPALKDAVAGGQYTFPQGLFFGGSGPQATVNVLRDHLPGWIGPGAHRVLHLDLHTGLGASGTYKLLVDHPAGSPGAERLRAAFGETVQPWAKGGVSYTIRGGLGTWCKARLPRVEYDVLVAEFGTFGILRVIAALRAENRAHHWGRPDDRTTLAAKAELLEVFAPRDATWRRAVVTEGVALFDRAIAALE